jgi:hypothetical protein
MDSLIENDELVETRFIHDREDAISNMIEIFSIQSPSGNESSMINFLMEKVARIKGVTSVEKDNHDNIKIIKGELGEGEYYPCMIAHMDKVFGFYSEYEVLQGDITLKDNEKKEILWGTCKDIKTRQRKDCGGVGDDGSGIYVALEALKHFDKIKIVFTSEEEIGGLGARKLDLNFFKDVGYILEGDRRGSSDLIIEYFHTQVCSNEFLLDIQDLCSEFGFSKAYGTFTDVMELAERGIGVSVMNFSVGYYNAHTEDEYTIIDELLNSTEFALSVITHLGRNKYEHIMEDVETSSSLFSGSRYSYYDIYDEDNPRDDLNCTCSTVSLYSNSFDLDCNACNPVSKIHEHMCDCGGDLEERLFTYNCPTCGHISIKTT